MCQFFTFFSEVPLEISSISLPNVSPQISPRLLPIFLRVLSTRNFIGYSRKCSKKESQGFPWFTGPTVRGIPKRKHPESGNNFQWRFRKNLRELYLVNILNKSRITTNKIPKPLPGKVWKYFWKKHGKNSMTNISRRLCRNFTKEIWKKARNTSWEKVQNKFWKLFRDTREMPEEIP